MSLTAVAVNGLMMWFSVAALGWRVSAQPQQWLEPLGPVGEQSSLCNRVDLKRDTGHQGSGEFHGSAIPHVLCHTSCLAWEDLVLSTPPMEASGTSLDLDPCVPSLG